MPSYPTIPSRPSLPFARHRVFNLNEAESIFDQVKIILGRIGTSGYLAGITREEQRCMRSANELIGNSGNVPLQFNYYQLLEETFSKLRSIQAHAQIRRQLNEIKTEFKDKLNADISPPLTPRAGGDAPLR